MGKIGKISYIKKFDVNNTTPMTLNGSLAANGYPRFPGTTVRFTPFKEKNGKYRTGLDENALYIKQMEKFNPEEAEQEKARVRSLREYLEAATNLDLSPTSNYYMKLMDAEFGTETRARVVKLNAAVNLFNLDNPYDAITYSWLRVHEDIAPSFRAWKEGRVKNSMNIQFFVDDEEYEQEIAYKENQEVDKAIVTLSQMMPGKMFKVARLLGLPVREDEIIATYNELTKFIKEITRNGKKTGNVQLFNKLVSMTDENFHIKFLVDEAIAYNVYRLKSGRVYEGEVPIGKDKQEVCELLSTPKYQEDVIALEEKIAQRKKLESV